MKIIKIKPYKSNELYGEAYYEALASMSVKAHNDFKKEQSDQLTISDQQQVQMMTVHLLHKNSFNKYGKPIKPIKS